MWCAVVQVFHGVRFHDELVFKTRHVLALLGRQAHPEEKKPQARCLSLHALGGQVQLVWDAGKGQLVPKEGLADDAASYEHDIPS